MPQFFENEKCTACGKKIGPKDRTITSKGVI
jgi:hypothetical protein